MTYLRAHTYGTTVSIAAEASVETGRHLTEVNGALAQPTGPPHLAIASEVIDQLDTVLRARVAAVGRQTFVDVSLTSPPHIPRGALTFVVPHLVNTSPPVVTRACKAIVIVDLTGESARPRGTRASERVDEVVTRAPVLAGALLTFVDVILAVGPLEAVRAVARVPAN